MTLMERFAALPEDLQAAVVGGKWPPQYNVDTPPWCPRGVLFQPNYRLPGNGHWVPLARCETVIAAAEIIHRHREVEAER